jgi:hypothetical protein
MSMPVSSSSALTALVGSGDGIERVGDKANRGGNSERGEAGEREGAGSNRGGHGECWGETDCGDGRNGNEAF